jgi:hypothetical protein
VEEVRLPAIELRQKREAVLNTELDRKTAQGELGSEQHKQSMLAAEIERQELDIHRLALVGGQRDRRRAIRWAVGRDRK